MMRRFGYIRRQRAHNITEWVMPNGMKLEIENDHTEDRGDRQFNCKGRLEKNRRERWQVATKRPDLQ
jgi:hypothetical protein